jgi:transposase
MSIPGVKPRISGDDRRARHRHDRIPTPKHLASWAKMCPRNDESTGHRRSGKTGEGNQWLRATLTEAPSAASHSKHSYPPAQYQRLGRRRGHNKAVTTVGHSP